MTPEQFTYWMQGFVELNGAAPTPEQWECIKDHLKTVFHKVTPDYGNLLRYGSPGDPKKMEPIC